MGDQTPQPTVANWKAETCFVFYVFCFKYSINQSDDIQSFDLNFFTCSEIFRSSRTQIFFKIGVLRNFTIFTGKHLCWSLEQGSFPVNIAKLLRTVFFIEHLWWLLLNLFTSPVEHPFSENHRCLAGFY